MISTRREQLIETALALFNQYGYHATGIDTILEQAGVAKKTLYNHFTSKEELMVAVLRRHDERFRHWFVKALESRTKNPRERLLAVFDVAGEWFRQSKFYGCLFINAAGEFPDPASPIRVTCRESKRLVRNYLEKLAAESGASDPVLLSKQVALLFEGAIVTAQVSADLNCVEQAKAAAAILLDQALETRDSENSVNS